MMKQLSKKATLTTRTQTINLYSRKIRKKSSLPCIACEFKARSRQENAQNTNKKKGMGLFRLCCCFFCGVSADQELLLKG